MKKLSILIADDHPVVRDGLRGMLESQPDFEVVGEAADGAQAIKLVEELRPEIVLMDLRMPLKDGISATREARQLMPETRILALTTFDDDELIFEAFRAGAAGYLLKDCTPEILREAILVTAQGESFMPPGVATRVVSALTKLSAPALERIVAPKGLSKRELEVLSCLADGASNKEIAQKLFIAEGTVKNHLTQIFEKLDLEDRTQAALRARELGI